MTKQETPDVQAAPKGPLARVPGGSRDVWVAAALIILFAVPLFIQRPYAYYVLGTMLIYGIAVMGLNLAMGYTGQVSLGHGAFFGLGAYSTAILTAQYGRSFWLALVVGTVVAGTAGILVGFTAPRLHEEYLVMSTLAFGLIVYYVLLNWADVTRGPMGIPGLPAPRVVIPLAGEFLFNTRALLLQLLVPVFAVALWLSRRIVQSSYGRALLAIREDEIAAETLGINITFHKVSVFAVSAAYNGFAGAFFVVFLGVASPESYDFSRSLLFLTMVMVGGMGSLAGPIVGVLLLTGFSEATRDYPVYAMAAYGLLLTLVIIFFPTGIAGIVRDRISPAIRRRRQRRSDRGDTPASRTRTGSGGG